MDLDDLRSALLWGSDPLCDLDPGIHDVVQTLVVGRSDVEFRGAHGDGERTVLRRGRCSDGTLFTGPLVSIVGQANVRLASLTIDGRRFGEEHGEVVDHRHPVSADPYAADFACMSLLDPPTRFEPANFVSPVEADVLVFDCRHAHVHDIHFSSPVTIGLAIGPGCVGLDVERVNIGRAEQLGMWIGSALPGMPPRPLPDALAERLPRDIRVRDCHIADSGAAGASIEGRSISFRRTTFEGNHRDFPFNESGGQVVIDYKSDGIVLDACTIIGEARLERPVCSPDPVTGTLSFANQSLAAVGVEASGSNLLFNDVVIRGQAREAIHLDGAHRVRIEGARTVLEGNHLAAARGVAPWCDGPHHNITITTSSVQQALGCEAGQIEISGVRCDNGVLVWSDGTIPGLRIPALRISACNLQGALSSGLTVGLNAQGHSLQGAGWFTGD